MPRSMHWESAEASSSSQCTSRRLFRRPKRDFDLADSLHIYKNIKIKMFGSNLFWSAVLAAEGIAKEAGPIGPGLVGRLVVYRERNVSSLPPPTPGL